MDYSRIIARGKRSNRAVVKIAKTFVLCYNEAKMRRKKNVKFGICKYDINGKHHLLSDEGKLLIFDIPEQAIFYLARKNLPYEEIADLSIEELTKEEIRDTYNKA